MARRRRRRRDREVQRDDYSITSSLLDERPYYRRAPEPDLSYLVDVEDRRRWDPEGDYRPARSVLGPSEVIEVYTPRVISGGQAKLPLRGRKIRNPFLEMPQSHMRFRVPQRVAVCVRREQRREVLFAKRFTGRGSRAKRTRNYWSDVSCGL